MSESVKQQVVNKKIIWFIGHPDDDKNGTTILHKSNKQQIKY